ncbi:zinc finger BED domain-containing protein RICESLEEPER 2-like [Silene latifolia]|uniref:zinc finger BED domain-containing protein RICESLEEPER 2-like n=1 Tax=Silene latifolia TaxID=37657 RepID=UPI003D778AE7
MTEPSQPISPLTRPIVEEYFVNVDDEMEIEEEMEAQVTEEDTHPHLNSTEDVLAEESPPPHPFKRERKAEVWKDFLNHTLVKGIWKSKCKYCDRALSHLKSGVTSHFNRHSSKCAKKALFSKRQKLINFLPSNSSASASQPGLVSALHDGQLDMSVMREGIAHWILMHEHPFRIVEEEGFNLMMKRGMPQYKSMSRHTIRSDYFKVYESDKKKLKSLLKGVEKISLTTDLWKSKPKKIEYMVLTGHFVDSNWKLQKRVLNFVHLPPPRAGRDIANCIFKCLKEWDIENKIFSISVDNASANDTCIQVLKDTFSLTKRLVCDGKLFHVRCCAHILNIMVQHGLKEVKTIISNVHESVDYINQSDLRLKKFTELVQQFNLKERRLVLECKTRWNSTYEMLACAIKFKKVFARLAQEDRNYTYCPNAEDWVKIEKLSEILEVFNDTTNIISGSEYPTSNLFLAEIYRIKVLLDTFS